MFLVPFPRAASAFTHCHDNAARSPALDVAETDAGYTVSIDLPGVARDDIKITIDGREVKVSAQAPAMVTGDGERLIYRERARSAFARRFTLPEELDQDASQAKLDNGVLALNLAKRRAAASKTLPVN
jgi:HSP20 family protein